MYFNNNVTESRRRIEKIRKIIKKIKLIPFTKSKDLFLQLIEVGFVFRSLQKINVLVSNHLPHVTLRNYGSFSFVSFDINPYRFNTTHGFNLIVAEALQWLRP